MDAKEYLKQPEKLDLLISNKLVEKEQWKSIALGITANMEGERVQSSGSQQKMADALNKAMDIEKEIAALIDRFVDTKKEVIQTIEKLPAEQYDICHKRYIQGIALKDIAELKNKDYTTITTTHGRALANVQAILEGGGSNG